MNKIELNNWAIIAIRSNFQNNGFKNKFFPEYVKSNGIELKILFIRIYEIPIITPITNLVINELINHSPTLPSKTEKINDGYKVIPKIKEKKPNILDVKIAPQNPRWIVAIIIGINNVVILIPDTFMNPICGVNAIKSMIAKYMLYEIIVLVVNLFLNIKSLRD